MRRYIEDYEKVQKYSTEGLEKLYKAIPVGHHDKEVVEDLLLLREWNGWKEKTLEELFAHNKDKTVRWNWKGE